MLGMRVPVVYTRPSRTDMRVPSHTPELTRDAACRDTENDASDKFRLMDALFQAVEQYFRDAIGECHAFCTSHTHTHTYTLSHSF